MAGRRVYRGSEVNVLLQNEDSSAGNFQALLSSDSSHAGFAGSRSMLNFEEACNGRTISQQFYIPREIEETIEEDLDDCLHQPEKKRRLSATQVQFLEKSFEVENKLEPERKVQLAKELGLQPRQVAIWFQNRRARWKNKQLEKDYDVLKLKYNALMVDYENMLDEKEKLKEELAHLTNKVLLQEKQNNTAETVEVDNLLDQKSVIDMKRGESQLIDVAVKQEAQSSTNSAESESGSPHETSRLRTDSFNAFEATHSEISYVGDNEEVKGYHEFLKLEDHTGNFDFPVEDHPFWSWH